MANLWSGGPSSPTFSLSPKKKTPDRRLPERLQPGKYHIFSFIQYTSCILFDVTLHSLVLPAGQIGTFSRRFFPKVKAKSCLDLQSREESLHFHWILSWCYHSLKELTYSFTRQYLLRDLLHNSLQVTKFSLLIFRSVYIAWCSLPSSIVGWSGVPTRFRTIGSLR